MLSGLQQGDSVAAAGTFLIDAETRLNPAAAATYLAPAADRRRPAPAVPLPPAMAALRPVKRVEPSAAAQANIDKLPADERAEALAQATCPVTGLALGAMGVPVKITVNGQAVFLCCRARAGGPQPPEEVLRRVEEFRKAALK